MVMLSLICLLVVLCSGIIEAFFLFKDKHEPILFCIKICPLYCSPRRRDEDASSLIYIDDIDEHSYYPYYEDHEPHPYHRFCKPKPKPTTPKPKPTTPKPTTTDIPYFYSDYYDYAPIPYHYWWKPKPTPEPTTTTEMPTTTMEPTWICMVCLKKCGFPPMNN